MGQIEACRRGALLVSTETTVIDEDGRVVDGSKKPFLKKRNVGTERADKAAPERGVEKFFGEMPTWELYPKPDPVDVVIVPAIDGNFDPSTVEMIPFERQFQTFHSLQNYFLLNELLAPGTRCPSSTPSSDAPRAAFVERFTERPYHFIRAATPQVLLDEVERVLWGLAHAAFTYERPERLSDAPLLAGGDGDARPLAGGTDLIIRIRDGSIKPATVVDVKGITEFERDMRVEDGWLRIGARTTMTDLIRDEHIRRDYTALAEAAAYVGSVQIRNRATLAGNICNASPAADTAPALLVYGARVIAVGEGGRRTIPLDDFFVRSGVTTLAAGELVEAIEMPPPAGRRGAVHARRTRRRGHDLASVTLAVSIDEDGITRLSYGSVGPRPVLVTDDSGVLADPSASEAARRSRLDELFADASPSARSMRSSPEYRLAMLRVMGMRAIVAAQARLVA